MEKYILFICQWIEKKVFLVCLAFSNSGVYNAHCRMLDASGTIDIDFHDKLLPIRTWTIHVRSSCIHTSDANVFVWIDTSK